MDGETAMAVGRVEYVEHRDEPRRETPADESLDALTRAIERMELMVERLATRMQPYTINSPHGIGQNDGPSPERCEFLNRLDAHTASISATTDRLAGIIDRLQI